MCCFAHKPVIVEIRPSLDFLFIGLHQFMGPPREARSARCATSDTHMFAIRCRTRGPSKKGARFAVEASAGSVQRAEVLARRSCSNLNYEVYASEGSNLGPFPCTEKPVLSPTPSPLSLAPEQKTVPSKLARELVRACGAMRNPSSISDSEGTNLPSILAPSGEYRTLAEGERGPATHYEGSVQFPSNTALYAVGSSSHPCQTSFSKIGLGLWQLNVVAIVRSLYLTLRHTGLSRF